MSELVTVQAELARKIATTAGARFNASRRMIWHEKSLEWTVALASLALIVIPLLLTIASVPAALGQKLNIYQTILALGVLVFSLLLGKQNYGVRAERMHRCALELNGLLRTLSISSKGTEGELLRVGRKYDHILAQHENHNRNDYERWLLYRRDKELVDKTRWFVAKRWLIAHVMLWAEFLPYALLVVIECWIAFVILKALP